MVSMYGLLPQCQRARVRAACFAALALFLALGASSAHAIEHDAQHWHNVNAFGRLAPSSALYYLELQPRASLTTGPTVALLRSALGVEVARGLTLWAGVGAIPAYDAPFWQVNELRLWQQAQFTERAGPAQLLLRLRLEQRAFEARTEVGHRGRALLRGALDIPGTERKFAVLAFDEVFVGVVGVDGKAAQGFDQNRAFLGVLYRPAPWWGFEVGYLNVALGDPRAESARMFHVLAAMTSFNLL